MHRLLCAFVISAATASAFQSPDEAADKDVYAIYSLMLTKPATSHGKDDNARYLIQETTHPGNPERPCVQPPKEREAEYREVLADFERRKNTQRKLERKFEIPKSYILLSAEDADEFARSRMSPHLNEPPESDERFQGVVDLITLTNVFFNPQRTLAVTQISTWCGGLCGLWLWKVFEKSMSSEWRELSWSTCMVVSENRLWDTDDHVEETNRSIRDRGGYTGGTNAAGAAR